MRPLTLEEFLAELGPQQVDVFADGACSGNPGPGGWGVVWLQEDRRATKNGGEKTTTNNRMELRAAIQALEALPATVPVRLTTDSQYVKNGIELWIRNWRQKGWLTTDRKPVKNQDLWKRLDSLCEEHAVTWAWVKGHSGHEENERADALARQAITRVMMGFEG